MAAVVPVIFRCDGGIVDGLGHVMRCLTLARSFCDDGRGTPAFLAHSPDSVAQRQISSRGFQFGSAAGPAGSDEDLAGICAHLSPRSPRPILVVDNRNISNAYLQRCRDFAYVVKICDNDAGAWPCDAIVDYNIGVDEKSYRQANENPALHLIGTEYNLLRDEFFTTPKKASGRPRVLITMGGEDPHNHTSWLLRGLGDLFASCDLTVVVGAAHPDVTAVCATQNKHCRNAKLIVDTRDMAQYMADADIAFTAGGTTCYELAAMGVAQLAVTLEEHQRPFVQKLEESSCLLSAADYLVADPASAREAFRKLMDTPALRLRLGAAGKRLFAEPGAPRVVRALLDHYENRLN
jgi:UDP-2,4-diacetamido-2,4,6-trideoxy-beta-L-altropyranose hydrolase